MDQLSQEEQADVKKMSSERIRLVLARDGADVDELTKADRAQLLDMMAHHMLNGGNDESANAAPEDRHLQLLERQIQLQEAELRFRQEQTERERLERATKDAEWRQRVRKRKTKIRGRPSAVPCGTYKILRRCIKTVYCKND